MGYPFSPKLEKAPAGVEVSMAHESRERNEKFVPRRREQEAPEPVNTDSAVSSEQTNVLLQFMKCLPRGLVEPFELNYNKVARCVACKDVD